MFDARQRVVLVGVLGGLFGAAGCKHKELSTRALPPGGEPLRIEAKQAPVIPARWDVALIADPQLHNFLGGKLKSMSPLAARAVTSVARRPGVLNVLGQLVLDAFIDHLGQRAPLMLVLGDVANMGCTGEFDRFAESVRARGLTWLAVHGNHDSFLAGNFSGFHRAGKWCATAEAADGVLWKESRWTPSEGRDYAYGQWKDADESWPQACAEPQRDSVPMTKGIWTRRYLQEIEEQGVGLQIGGARVSARPDERGDTPFNVARCAEPFRFEGHPDPHSTLGKHEYWLSGEWRPRDRVATRGYMEPWEHRCPGSKPYDERGAHEYGAFVVQSVDIGDAATAILIDTSIREDSVNGTDFSEYPGRFGRIGAAQMAEVSRHRCKAGERGRAVVLVGHHPWTDLPEAERQALWQKGREACMQSPILYISGHTHLESSMIVHARMDAGLPELNLGSVVDWPMEAGLLSVSTREVLWRIVGLHAADDGGLGCSGGDPARSYEQIAPSSGNCDDKVDRSDLAGFGVGWKEPQVPRTDLALKFLAGHGLHNPATGGTCKDPSYIGECQLGDAVTGLVEAARKDVAFRERGLEFARCASLAVLTARVSHSGTCPRRQTRSLTAASVFGFSYSRE